VHEYRHGGGRIGSHAARRRGRVHANAEQTCCRLHAGRPALVRAHDIGLQRMCQQAMVFLARVGPVPTQIVDPARRTDSPLQEVRHALIGIGQSQTADERVSENENLLRRRIEVFAVAVDICSDLARVVSHPREVAKDGSQIVDAARIACCRRSRGLEGANHPMLCLQVWISQLGKTHRPPDRDALPPLLVAPHQF